MTKDRVVIVEIRQMGKSEWIKESSSNYTCPKDTVMIGREHKGDENGDTRYTYGLLTLNNVVCTISSGTWSSWIKESSSNYTCPKDTVMIGREHKGDENGNTRYKYADVKLGDASLGTTNEEWGVWIKESNSNYTCQKDTLMIGREHKGDENGNTRYKYAQITPS